MMPGPPRTTVSRASRRLVSVFLPRSICKPQALFHSSSQRVPKQMTSKHEYEISGKAIQKIKPWYANHHALVFVFLK